MLSARSLIGDQQREPTKKSEAIASDFSSVLWYKNSTFGAKLFGYEINTLPLKDLTRLTWKKNESANHAPCFFKGTFAAKHGIDTFVDFSGFGHGYIWINGFNLGRYDSAGPQMTLYVPGPLLNDQNNEIIILDIDPIGQKQHIQFIDYAILEGEAKELS